MPLIPAVAGESMYIYLDARKESCYRKVETGTILVTAAIYLLLPRRRSNTNKHRTQKMLSNKVDKPKKNPGFLYTHKQ